MSRGLSKSRLMSLLQCERKLWLSAHRPDLEVTSAGVQGVFDTGHQVGEFARRQESDRRGTGVLIDVRPHGWAEGVRRCAQNACRIGGVGCLEIECGLNALGADDVFLSDIESVDRNTNVLVDIPHKAQRVAGRFLRFQTDAGRNNAGSANQRAVGRIYCTAPGIGNGIERKRR